MIESAGVGGTSAYRDDYWDLEFMKIEYGGYDVELGGAEGAQFFDRLEGRWRKANISFTESIPRSILGVVVPVMPVDQLLDYKIRLGREVDEDDVNQIRAAAKSGRG